MTTANVVTVPSSITLLAAKNLVRDAEATLTDAQWLRVERAAGPERADLLAGFLRTRGIPVWRAPGR